MRDILAHRAAAAALALTCLAASSSPLATTSPSSDRAIVHVLNRVGFGPRQGDVAAVRALGIERYLEQQLRPERIADVGIDARLAKLTTVTLSGEQILEQFERPEMEARRERQLKATANGTDGQEPRPSMEEMRRANLVIDELTEQKLLRAVYSERQLQEVLADFWFNHFNVDMRKGRDRFLLTEYEREAIRPHVLGKFRDLLEATAKSPAMLFYLDNWMSVDPATVRTDERDMRRPENRMKQGLNENYGRELMELHTLGVDGGYTQKDVTEVARAFTGWTMGGPRQGNGYLFDARHHDRGEKTVLGHRIKAGGGEEDGQQVLDILAKHPSTARFIATKLARRFVSDTPAAALVGRVASRFIETDGDIREVMRALLTSSEFLAPESYRAKVKTPFEFLVSAVRATGAEVSDARPLLRTLQQLGMPLYACQPPTGYKDTADAWVNTGALLSRMNFALSLTSGRLRGLAVDPQLPIAWVLNGEASETTLATIAKATTAPQMGALTLGSPEFQRR